MVSSLVPALERLHLIRAAHSSAAALPIACSPTARLVRRIDKLVDSLKGRSHDHESCHQDTSVHLYHGKDVVVDVRVLWFSLRERVGVEHDDESSDSQTSVDCTQKDETNQ